MVWCRKPGVSRTGRKRNGGGVFDVLCCDAGPHTLDAMNPKPLQSLIPYNHTQEARCVARWTKTGRRGRVWRVVL